MSARGQSKTTRAGAHRGFTLIELIAVVTLLLVVLGIAVPAFTGMINASQRSLAENSLRAGVTIARDLAVLNGQDSGLLFVRESNGRTRLIPVVKVGTVKDAILNQNGSTGFNPDDPTNFPSVERDVFAAVDFSSPMQLPRGWSIAGYADAGTIDRAVPTSSGAPLTDGWYDSEAYGDNGMNLTSGATPDPVRDTGHWLLPESDLYEKFMQGPGTQPPSGFSSQVSGADLDRTPRQSFMVRFESGTGLLQRGGRPALVLDPRSSSLGRGDLTAASNDARWLRADRINDAETWANRVLTTVDVNSDGFVAPNDLSDPSFRMLAIGNFSNDTVLAGTVSRLAVFQESDLAGGLGASGLNRETDSLYLPIAEQGRIAFDMGLFDGSTVISNPEDVRLGITRWIQGDTNFIEVGFANSDTDNDGSVYGDAEDTGTGTSADEPVARIYFVHPGTGDLTEVAR